MRLEPYRQVLAIRPLRSLLLVSMFARIPITAAGVTMTLHVVESLDRGYGAAGAVGAAMTLGAALGAPILGRLVDRRGLRLVLGVTAVAEAVYWTVAPSLPYVALLVTAAVGGFLSLPVFSVVRQSIAALVPESQRRQAYAIDSMSVEVSFMVGPVLAVLMVQEISGAAAMYTVGGSMVASGLALYALNPPVRGAGETTSTARLPRREWLTPKLLGVLALSAATTCVLAGTDVAIIAELRGAGEVHWAGVVLGLWGVYSLVGGFVYGGLRRVLSPVMLVLLLGVFTIPMGIANGALGLSLTLALAGLLCAPALTATTDAMSRLVPAGARGEAMGWHGSALTIGLAVGAPLAGLVMDRFSPAWGFVAVGSLAAVVALVMMPLARRIPTPSEDDVPPAEVPDAPVPAATGPALTVPQ